MPLRLPGGEFWPSLRELDEKRKRTDETKEQISKIDAELSVL